MTSLATHPLNPDQLNLLDAITAVETPLGSLRFDDFKAACEAVADADGVVNPNLVSAYLHERHRDMKPNSYSAFWSKATSRNGFMDTLPDDLVRIDPKYSKGNGGKSVPRRRLRVVAEVAA